MSYTLNAVHGLFFRVKMVGWALAWNFDIFTTDRPFSKCWSDKITF